MSKPCAKNSSAKLDHPAIITQPLGITIQTALLLNAGSIENAVNNGGEFFLTLEGCYTRALSFRATETEFPLIAGLINHFLLAARLRVGQRDRIKGNLRRNKAHLHAFTGHSNALFFEHGALFRGHLLLELTEDQ